MLQISPEKIAHIIIRAREYDSGVNPWAHSGGRPQRGVQSELRGFIANLNEDEQASLVAVMWIGRESFEPEELEEAVETARVERTTPTEDYLMGEPRLADLLEAGLDALGISPEDAEDDLTRPV